MISIINYTRQHTETEITDSTELKDIIELYEGEEWEISNAPMECIRQPKEASYYLDQDEETQGIIQAIGEYDSSYYDSIIDVDLSDRMGMIIGDGDITNSYQLAKYLESTIGLEEELNMILGCTQSAYESLSSYIRADDIAHTIDTEWNFIYVNGKAYNVIS